MTGSVGLGRHHAVGPYGVATNLGLALLAAVFVVALGIWLSDSFDFPFVPHDDRSLLFGLVLLGIAGLAATLAAINDGEGYVAVLVLLAPLVPILAAVLVVLFKVAGAEGAPLREQSLLVGMSVTAGLWAFGSLLFKWMARVDTAQPRSYGELVARTRSLRARLEAVSPAQPEEQDVDRRSLAAQIRNHLGVLEAELGIGGVPAAGFRYAQASGYINLWRFLHRAEECLIGLEPRAWGLAAARTDRLRLSRSSIGNRRNMLATLDLAVDSLENVPVPPATTTAQPARRVSDQTAMSLLQEIRRGINASRDDGWEGLIRGRNRLLRTVLLSSTVTFLFIALGLALGASGGALGAAGIFFLVGTVVGLIAILRAERRSRRAVDDYGLFEARLIATPMLSGLTGVAGVVLVALTPGILGTQAGNASDPTLAQIFSLDSNLRGLITAAIFGLAPDLLISWLTRDADKAKENLASSSAAGATKEATDGDEDEEKEE